MHGRPSGSAAVEQKAPADGDGKHEDGPDAWLHGGSGWGSEQRAAAQEAVRAGESTWDDAAEGLAEVRPPRSLALRTRLLRGIYRESNQRLSLNDVASLLTAPVPEAAGACGSTRTGPRETPCNALLSPTNDAGERPLVHSLP